MTAKMLGPIGVEAFERRGIQAETAAKFGIYTAKKGKGPAVIPDGAGNIVVFPFIERGATVKEKYRGPGKQFWQSVGGRRTFWNADALDDPSLEAGHMPLVITEGEIDALTAIECGFPLSVSVPDGAPGVQDSDEPEELQPIGDETTGKFEFLWNNRDRLKRVKRFIIAADADRPGKRLAAELVRRLSASRCYFIEYPAGCKDLNDVLAEKGPEAVAAILNAAKPYPVRGLYRLSDYPDRSELPVYSTGWWTVDKHLKLFAGEFMVVTGIPSHGKSTWVLNLLCHAASLHGWHTALFSPEMPTLPYLRNKLRRIKGGSQVDCDAFIDEYFRFIDADPTGKEDEDFDLDWIIDKATEAVLRDGIRCLVIDPWNEVEHAKRRDETMTDYIGRSIRVLKRFARQYDVAVIVIAHPTKDVARDGKSRPVTLYDIEGCYSDDTEVLTKRGWLHHGQLTMSDDVACFDPETSAVQYHQPERIIRKEHSGQMRRFKGYGYDLLVTPNHRMLVKAIWDEPVGDQSGRGRPIRFEKGKWSFVEAQELPSANFTLPLAGKPIDGADPMLVTIADRTYPSDAFWKLVGWYVAEGYFGKTGLTWSQAEGPLAKAFTEAFAEAGIPATVGWQQPYGKGKQVVGRWYIGRRFCPWLFSWFGDQCGRGAANKRIPDAVFELSPRLKRVFLHAYLEGDGSRSRDGFRAITVSMKLRDDLQRLAVELGIATSTSTSIPSIEHHKIQYSLEFGGDHRREVTMRTQRNASREEYSGLVWCLTVPTGAYFVRRNGRVAVSGNSAHWYNKCDHGVVIDRPNAYADESIIRIAKVRFEETGEKGEVKMTYDRERSRYLTLDKSETEQEGMEI